MSDRLKRKRQQTALERLREIVAGERTVPGAEPAVVASEMRRRMEAYRVEISALESEAVELRRQLNSAVSKIGILHQRRDELAEGLHEVGTSGKSRARVLADQWTRCREDHDRQNALMKAWEDRRLARRMALIDRGLEAQPERVVPLGEIVARVAAGDAFPLSEVGNAFSLAMVRLEEVALRSSEMIARRMAPGVRQLICAVAPALIRKSFDRTREAVFVVFTETALEWGLARFAEALRGIQLTLEGLGVEASEAELFVSLLAQEMDVKLPLVSYAEPK